VAGGTCSADFPVRNAVQRKFPNDSTVISGFITKLSGNGEILYSTYLGGPSYIAYGTEINAIAVDAFGSAFVTGGTDSPRFPTTPGAVIGTFESNFMRPSRFAFIARLHPAGDRLLYSTLLGGERAHCTGGSSCIGVAAGTVGRAIAVDLSGNVFVAGDTDALDFPATPDALQPDCDCPRGSSKAFVAKLNPTGSALLYASYLGGSAYLLSIPTRGASPPRALSLDRAGSLYVAGITTTDDFPVTEGAWQTVFSPVEEYPERVPVGYLSKFDGASMRLVYSTYLGGQSAGVTGLAVDRDGSACILGTNAHDGFAVLPGGAARGSNFLLKVNPAGSALLVSTRLPEGLAAGGLARDSAGGLLLAGGDSGLVSRVEWRDAPVISLFGLANAAGARLSGRVAPGEIVSLYGLNLLPDPSPAAIPVAPVRVVFGGVAAPILYTQSDQINAIVPYRFPRGQDALLELVHDSVTVASLRVAVVDTDPEIFRTGGEFSQAIALNEDGTINSSANPARIGSVLSLFATGQGEVLPLPRDGEITGEPPPKPRWPISVEVGDWPAEIMYAGPAPGMVAGLMRIDLKIPPVPLWYDGWTIVRIEAAGRASDYASVWLAPL